MSILEVGPVGEHCFYCGKICNDDTERWRLDGLWYSHPACLDTWEAAGRPHQPHFTRTGHPACRSCDFGGLSHKTAGDKCVCECHGNRHDGYVLVAEAVCGDNPRTTVDGLTMQLQRGDTVRLYKKVTPDKKPRSRPVLKNGAGAG